MDNKIFIPIFPLSILPLPGELVPLHIFEERYRQLLTDMELNNDVFGIYYVAENNTARLGSLVKLEKIIKRYETGESDILVQCVGSFIMDRYVKHYHDKLYAGGNVIKFDDSSVLKLSYELHEKYTEYLETLGRLSKNNDFSLDDIANALDLSNEDRIKYLSILTPEKKNKFLLGRLKFKKFVIDQEIKYKNSFIMN